jgi:hypothetical protein
MPLIVSMGGSSGRTPLAPTIGSATAGNGQATVSFTAPTYLGKPTGTTYTAISSPGSITGTSATSPITVSGLSNGTAYTFVVNLSNGVVTSVNSSSSNSITPVAPPPYFAPPSFGPWFPPQPSFAPPRFGPLQCIDSQTLITVVGPDDTLAYKKAEDIVVGDILWAALYEEYTDESSESPEDWESAMLTNMRRIKTAVTNVIPSMKQTLYFNNDESTRMSFQQLVLVKPENENWQYIQTLQIEVGDTIMTYSPELDEFVPTLVSNITIDDEETRATYAISVEDTDLFIAGNVLVHNK